MTTFEQKHGRPKPPPIFWEHVSYTAGRLRYESVYGIFGVCKGAFIDERPWEVSHGVEILGSFPTHAEAIAYAHKLAQERNTN